LLQNVCSGVVFVLLGYVCIMLCMHHVMYASLCMHHVMYASC